MINISMYNQIANQALLTKTVDSVDNSTKFQTPPLIETEYENHFSVVYEGSFKSSLSRKFSHFAVFAQ
jgi:hypothetical protein